MTDTHERRLGANEAVFREINEAIERGQWPGEETSRASFRCECAQLGCTRILALSVEEYEEVRSYPRRFVVAVGHEQLEVERIVVQKPGYLVVEKRDAAAEVAEATDPRR
jgi:hypothetical protein